MYRYREWSRLPGFKVEVRKNGKTIRLGTVEQAMADNSVLWLEANGADGRVLFEASADYEIWVEPHAFYSLP